MSKQNDHDLLIKIDTDVSYIKNRIDCHTTEIEKLKIANQDRKDWQEDTDTKIKLYAGVATFIGGLIVFLTDRIINWFVIKK